jgi:hypothetical protein
MVRKDSKTPKNIRFSNYILTLSYKYLRQRQDLTFSELIRLSLHSYLLSLPLYIEHVIYPQNGIVYILTNVIIKNKNPQY